MANHKRVQPILPLAQAAPVLPALPDDLFELTDASSLAQRYPNSITVSTDWSGYFNPNVTTQIRNLFPAAITRLRVQTSQKTGLMVLLPVDANTPAPKKSPRVRFAKTGTNFTASLRDGLSQMGVSVPAGRICVIPVEVMTDPKLGPYILVKVNERMYEPSPKRQHTSKGKHQAAHTQEAAQEAATANGAPEAKDGTAAKLKDAAADTKAQEAATNVVQGAAQEVAAAKQEEPPQV